jgi:2-dehydro-3-deoxyphosphooctonate aldolase (KDO 8-P synthase)
MITLEKIKIGDNHPMVLIAGPCVVESRELILRTAEKICEVSQRHGVQVIFKASYKKANRTSGSSFSGHPMDEALAILGEVRRQFHLPILTDVHAAEEAEAAAAVADVLQIPAFLCRQTELLQAAGRTGKVINIKKGQFMAPEDMALQAKKVEAVGNQRILLTERGTTFGYHDLVVDMRSLPIMKASGHPVVLDATHSVQRPGGAGGKSGGQPQFIFPIARAGAAVGIDALFIETHPDPPRALSDAESQLPLELLDALLGQVVPIDRMVKEKHFSDVKR